MKLGCVVACIHLLSGCWGFPRPADVGGVDDGPICAANQALRCDSTDLVRCNSDGTAEVNEPCLLGCSTSALRCNDIDPSNGLAPYLDLTVAEPDLDLGTAATINTDDGTLVVDGKSVVVKSTVLAQTSAPSIRIFIVHSLTAADVKITGHNALAVVSSGDLMFGGVFAASASTSISGAGRFNDGTCKGAEGTLFAGTIAGSGGGGFGGAGGTGGYAITDSNGTQTAGLGGTPTGNPTLIPLRGGCDGAPSPASNSFGGGGGAIQLVSRARIAVNGVVAANGSSAFGGGGSGGGILLEAPVVEVSGAVVANGGAGGAGCFIYGENGRLDDLPAAGGNGCSSTAAANGGNGGAGNTGARNGVSLDFSGTAGSATAIAGHGGGGVGRIRVNTASGGFNRTGGLFSPNPSTGAIVIR